MIQANELRIGNFVMSNFMKLQEVCVVHEIASETIVVSNPRGVDEHYQIADHILPIPLTEEWLLKFGFEQQDCPVPFEDAIIFINNGVQIYLEEQGFEYAFDTRKRIEYVHQLQNLYFALTSTELSHD